MESGSKLHYAEWFHANLGRERRDRRTEVQTLPCRCLTLIYNYLEIIGTAPHSEQELNDFR